MYSSEVQQPALLLIIPYIREAPGELEYNTRGVRPQRLSDSLTEEPGGWPGRLKMKVSGVLLLLLLLVASAAATMYEDCGSVATVDKVDIEDCDLWPCRVTRPDLQDVNITFTPVDVVNNFSATIDANIGGVHFPWPGPGGCDLLLEGGECPLQPGTTYEYHSVMSVLVEYPSLSVMVTWVLQDDQGRNQVCVSFPVIISRGLPPAA